MDDYYVYFELSNDNSVGKIKAVSPHEIKELEFPYIHISAEAGMKFTVGNESLGQWQVEWSNAEQVMVLVKIQHEVTVAAPTILRRVVADAEEPAVIITWMGDHFNVFTPEKVSTEIRKKLTFFVTRYEDPNIIYGHFQVAIGDMVNGIDVDMSGLPEKFSMFTLTDKICQLRFEQ